jgi:hypothetical protein
MPEGVAVIGPRDTAFVMAPQPRARHWPMPILATPAANMPLAALPAGRTTDPAPRNTAACRGLLALASIVVAVGLCRLPRALLGTDPSSPSAGGQMQWEGSRRRRLEVQQARPRQIPACPRRIPRTIAVRSSRDAPLWSPPRALRANTRRA